MTAAKPESRPPYNLPALIMFTVSTGLLLTAFPWYLLTHAIGAGAWIAGLVLLYACGLSITGNRHRLWAHRA